MTKKQKQDSIDQEVSFGSSAPKEYKNMAKAASQFNTPTSKTTPPPKIDHSKQQGYEKALKVVIHRDAFQRFNVCSRKYDDAFYETYKATLARKFFLQDVISYYVKFLENQNLYKTAPDNFIYNATKKGRRKKNDRSFSSDEKVAEFFGVTQKSYDEYLNVMYSYFESKDNLDPSIFTTGYFFYDLIDFTEKHITSIIEYAKENTHLEPFNKNN
ncbi:hypothetical protein [Aquimarina mytili]|uniref:Uncharacterized protein n=1 Tax=Aquimarina mytili TaxID=874423 RepID=A0A937A1S6_9FLAO|nr:hypothetical protein [Aquimarina mytili]MBL0686033.1 hypothetical protein [Aquimarina mytili]